MEIFEKQKNSAISGVDFSRKGSIDVKIIDLSIFINNQKDYFTTSSCSGRIILFDDSVRPQTTKISCNIYSLLSLATHMASLSGHNQQCGEVRESSSLNLMFFGVSDN